MKTTILILALICLGGAAARTAGNACPAGQYQLESKICKSCNPGSTSNGCVACAAPDGKCTECAANWVLNDKGSCEKFHDSCAEKLCDISGTQACGDCADGYRPARKDTTDTAYCVACAQGNCVSCTVDECTECRDGFFLENKACTACSAGCVECTSATACTTCGSGYFSNAGACTACGSGCSVCTAADKCTTCSVDNILNSTTGACSQKTGCEEGDGTDKCKTCRDGYRLLADGSCKACDSSAQTCDGSGADQTILTCNVNLILATATATAKAACQTRTDGVCLNQDAAGVCTKCEGANWVVSKGKCVLCSSVLTNCKSCQAGDATTAASCSACSDSSYATGSPITACTACSGTCKSCTSAGCSECADGYYKASATATSCTSCDAGGVKSCTVAKNAAVCFEGYGAQEHGICWKCDPTYNCKTCSEYQKCATCVAGSTVQTSSTAATASTLNQCVVCDPNCATTGTCPDGPGTCSGATAGSECKDATYKLNTITKKCTLVCEAAFCTTCTANDRGKCATCNDGYRVDASGQCVACLNTNCRTCADATTCSGCKNGYSFSATPADAQYCTTACAKTTNLIECTWGAGPAFTVYKCKEGFGLTVATTGDTCEACVPTNCKLCQNDKAACTACNDGFFLASATTCTACSNAKAATCSAAAVDTKCKPGNCLGNTDVCYTCPVNCKVGSQTVKDIGITADSVCPSCADGYVAHTTATNPCVQCTVANCKVCAFATATTACTTCKTDYFKKSDNTCMFKVDETTDGCVRADGTYEKCSSCLSGYYLDGTTCKACPANCKCAAADTCDSCVNANNFYDSAATPKSCKTCTVTNCKACAADAAKCTECNAGYFKESDTKCTACTTDCASCTKADSCDTCKDSYFSFTLPTGVTGTVKFCAACASNCKTCDVKVDGSQTCTECKAGFYLNGKSCSSADCSGTDGKVCNKCLYGKILKDGKCADCTGDNSCPASCNAATTGPTGSTGNSTNTTSATDSGSKIAFSLFVLAFFAILGHMMI